jgi:hypothetical protein
MQAVRLRASHHIAQGDVLGQCGQSCALLCNHQACYNDYVVSNAGQTCECDPPPAAKYRCGGNSQCNTSLDQCVCMPGYSGNPESALGCVPDTTTPAAPSNNNATSGTAASGQWGTCTLDGATACQPDLHCARTSRSDPANVCCNGRYVQGELCPSKSQHDCAGALQCGQRNAADVTSVCCPEILEIEQTGTNICTVL